MSYHRIEDRFPDLQVRTLSTLPLSSVSQFCCDSNTWISVQEDEWGAEDAISGENKNIPYIRPTKNVERLKPSLWRPSHWQRLILNLGKVCFWLLLLSISNNVTDSRHSLVQSLSCPALCDSMDCSMPGTSVHYCLPEFAQIHVHWVSDPV